MSALEEKIMELRREHDDNSDFIQATDELIDWIANSLAVGEDIVGDRMSPSYGLGNTCRPPSLSHQ